VRGIQSDFTAASLVRYALACDLDPYDAVVHNEKLNGRTHWLDVNPTLIGANEAVMQRDAERRAFATKLSPGDHVIIEGCVLRLISAPDGDVALYRLTPDEVAALINSVSGAVS
jgi:hypothetical protein